MNQTTNTANNQNQAQNSNSDAMSNHATTQTTNVDASEVSKFTRLANEWWDKQGAFSTLHEINPLRLNWIEQNTQQVLGSGLQGKKVVDIGCGGGWFDEALTHARSDAIVLALVNTDEVLPSLPTHPWDRRVHVISTPAGLVSAPAPA